jgi:hypothetical protein
VGIEVCPGDFSAWIGSAICSVVAPEGEQQLVDRGEVV